MDKLTTIEDIEGPWKEPDFDSNLVSRCRNAWSKPLQTLTNQELATFLRQKIAIELLRPIAEERIQMNFEDGTEIRDDELQNALISASH